MQFYVKFNSDSGLNAAWNFTLKNDHFFIYNRSFNKEYNMSGVLNETTLNSNTNDPNSPNLDKSLI